MVFTAIFAAALISGCGSASGTGKTEAPGDTGSSSNEAVTEGNVSGAYDMAEQISSIETENPQISGEIDAGGQLGAEDSLNGDTEETNQISDGDTAEGNGIFR